MNERNVAFRGVLSCVIPLLLMLPGASQAEPPERSRILINEQEGENPTECAWLKIPSKMKVLGPDGQVKIEVTISEDLRLISIEASDPAALWVLRDDVPCLQPEIGLSLKIKKYRFEVKTKAASQEEYGLLHLRLREKLAPKDLLLIPFLWKAARLFTQKSVVRIHWEGG